MARGDEMGDNISVGGGLEDFPLLHHLIVQEAGVRDGRQLLLWFGFDAMGWIRSVNGNCSGPRRLMNAPLRHLPLDAKLGRPLAPSLERQRLRLCLILIFLDGLSILTNFLLAGGFYLGEFPSEIALRQGSLIAPVFVLLAVHREYYRPPAIFSIRKSIQIITYAFLLSSSIFLIFSFYSKNTAEFSRVVFTIGCVLSAISVIAIRWFARFWIGRIIGPSLQNVLVIHAGGPPLHLDYAIHINASEYGLSADTADPANLDRLGRCMENMDRVIINCDHDDRGHWAPLLKAAGARGEFVSVALRELGVLEVQNEAGFVSLVVSARPLGLGARVMKRLMDVSLSSIVLLALSPLMGIVALLIKLEDGGPILFRQRRVGRGNRFFWIYKFRSMRVEVGDSEACRLTSRNDDRTTQIGRFIRRTSIDELPQLFNVLRGDMSLVGPRPHALGALAGERLYWEIDGRYWHRHALRPGLTGLAQVRGFRGNTVNEGDLVSRLQADLEYISNWSLWGDVKILIRTLLVIKHINAY